MSRGGRQTVRPMPHRRTSDVCEGRRRLTGSGRRLRWIATTLCSVAIVTTFVAACGGGKQAPATDIATTPAGAAETPEQESQEPIVRRSGDQLVIGGTGPGPGRL